MYTSNLIGGDALSYTEKVLCFVELKGWKEFLSHQPIAQKPLASEKEKQVLEKSSNYLFEHNINAGAENSYIMNYRK